MPEKHHFDNLFKSLQSCQEEFTRGSESPLKRTEGSQGAGGDAQLWIKVQLVDCGTEGSFLVVDKESFLRKFAAP